ncbi:isoleucine--tRNA ligase [Buchnera aphidicola]|uniref:Isoleucine--tRNA ligase n=1 Tax=Buchnera aphidicola (Sarucallis kahawaluokalani) TaxID=1241878 RepID=A0A4D6Y7L0_9GAMM|nr:isoleucine--tRNA ligase [Buchnera aphidicola]QCI25906.1 isoleucine--tRNA ligase [Buchnera aphidicola (Sarucallis kahawaluokalani)]
MKTYKETLNLPQTKFPMKGNLSQKEPEILKDWNKKEIYQIIQQNNKNKKIFLLHDGPPYANGNIHIGHAINKILKDIIIKSKTLSNFYTPYIPFWDCHGLPIEHQIEKKNNTLEYTIKKKKFRKMCQQYATQQVKKQKLDFIRLGIFGDWNNSQLTMHKKLEANVINVLKKIIKKKYLYLGAKPVHWCTKCQSALADAEVEYDNQKTTSIIVKFKILTTKYLKNIFPIPHKVHTISIIIWTTTPWSLPANRAVAVHPNVKYQLIQFQDNYIILAKKLIPQIMNTLKIHQWNVITTVFGKDLENIQCKHPFLDFNIPIILSKHVTLEMGTGAVHIAPDHGEDDYLISQKYNIKLANIIDEKGRYISDIHPDLDKKNIFHSNKIILDNIKKNNKLLHSNTIQHTYPHCWRHQTPIIYRATKQWFIKVSDHKLQQTAKNAIKQVHWIPKWGQKKMQIMLENRPDWCISRQRTWGIPMTLFIHKKTGKLHPDTINIMHKIEKMIALKGSEIWWQLDKKIFLGNDSHEYEKSTDILDVWFESGCIHYLNIYDLPQKKEIINMYLEGTDQYRGWFMSSLIIGTILNKVSPYNTILTHGFAVDNKGKKMSKSIGNIVQPSEIVNVFGSDILRLWVASTNYTHDMTISKDTIKQISENYRRIRNTSRFLLGNLYDFNHKIHTIPTNQMIALDLWIITKTKILQNKIIKLYQNFKFHKIIKHIIKFCSITLGSFYLDIIKDRQYTTQKNSTARRSCQTAIYYIIQSLVRWMTPILPFTAHEIWKNIPNINNTKSIFIKTWFTIKPILQKNIISDEFWKILFKIKIEVNKMLEKIKNKKKINTSLETKVIIYAKRNIYNTLILLEKELKFMLLVSHTSIQKDKYALENINSNKNIPEIKILIKKFLGIKCPRCWNFFNKINLNNQDKKICNRCNKNVNQNGEHRQFL